METLGTWVSGWLSRVPPLEGRRWDCKRSLGSFWHPTEESTVFSMSVRSGGTGKRRGECEQWVWKLHLGLQVPTS